MMTGRHIIVSANSVRPPSAKPHAIPSQKLAMLSEPRRCATVAIAAGTNAIQSKAAPAFAPTLFSGGSRGRLATADARLGFHVYIRKRRVFAWNA